LAADWFIIWAKNLSALAAFFYIVILYTFCQAIFSDNFAGHYELYMKIFLWFGAFCGILEILEKLRIKTSKKGYNIQ
jgi:glucan phosphoethanolaminetransferase (alkaline phosphatase superfamily)